MRKRVGLLAGVLALVLSSGVVAQEPSSSSEAAPSSASDDLVSILPTQVGPVTLDVEVSAGPYSGFGSPGEVASMLLRLGKEPSDVTQAYGSGASEDAWVEIRAVRIDGAPAEDWGLDEPAVWFDWANTGKSIYIAWRDVDGRRVAVVYGTTTHDDGSWGSAVYPVGDTQFILSGDGVALGDVLAELPRGPSVTGSQATSDADQLANLVNALLPWSPSSIRDTSLHASMPIERWERWRFEAGLNTVQRLLSFLDAVEVRDCFRDAYSLTRSGVEMVRDGLDLVLDDQDESGKSHILDGAALVTDGHRAAEAVAEPCGYPAEDEPPASSFGPDDLDTLTEMHIEAYGLWELGEHARARELQELVLDARTRILGPEHPDTLLTMNDLALTLSSQFELVRAQEVQEYVFETRTRVLGPDDPDTIGARSNLAITVFMLGDHSRARDMFEQVVDDRIRILGPEHPDTIAAIQSLAIVLASQGELAEAVGLFEQVLEVRTRVLGPEHPDTLTAAMFLGSTTTALEEATREPDRFSPAGTLEEARDRHTATRLPDGRVLVVGGSGMDGDLTSAEVWDPATEAFSPTGSTAEARINHTATPLPDGRVLVVGGRALIARERLASTEIWDPATETFTPAGSLAEARAFHTATPLPDGRVLVVGGRDVGNDIFASAEVWDPATESFTPAGSLAEARAFHTATPLPDGRVLVVGGFGAEGFFDPTASAELWDAATDSFTPAGSLAGARRGHSATLLPDGHVLIVGGTGESPTYDPGPAEIWDPATMSFSPAGSPIDARDEHTATLLSDGRVLVVGGDSSEGHTFFSAEVWDPATESFTPAGSLAEECVHHTATRLLDGRVLVVGGFSALTEVWAPSEE